MSENPNPRGWRSGSYFVDLGSVMAVSWGYEPTNVAAGDDIMYTPPQCAVVWLVGVQQPIYLRLTTEMQESLLNALEIYRSGR